MTNNSAFEPGGVRAVGARPQVAAWLLAVAVLVALMVMLGGATRLTHSGLSMVQWQPLMGVLPPMNEAAWMDVFERYKQYPEYQKINQGMSLEEFKSIFYFEYAHRVLGRLIGLAFALPFVWFWATGRIERRMRIPLVGLFLLGGLQGLIGWWMVKSGLVDRPDVSHYRLAVHLGVAVLIFGGLIWAALSLLFPRPEGVTKTVFVGELRLWVVVILTMIFLQILSGALVAGLDAGLIYNSFPTMNGYWLPPELGDLSPGWINLFENPVTVQFDHRIGAYICTILIVGLWLRQQLTPKLGAAFAGAARKAMALTLAALALQLALGIVTLLWVVPVVIAVLHQGGALLLFAAATLLAFHLHNEPESGEG